MNVQELKDKDLDVVGKIARALQEVNKLWKEANDSGVSVVIETVTYGEHPHWYPQLSVTRAARELRYL